ncbi:MAG: DUF418 domain-containing protein [Candidatus Latescibacterota bacterium]|nr:MAG: DUF418 domain-containing protein [Candidatus Latescibacterota bacterium]
MSLSPQNRDATSAADPSPPEAPFPRRAAPVEDADRIASIDVLRGFALLGILVVNIQSFAMNDATIFNPTAYGVFEGTNRWVWYLTHVFYDLKYMAMFSMLFGAGILLMTQRAEEKGIGSAALHYRRMGVLLVFGLLHGYLLWSGDILVWYALCGLIVYLFRKRSARTLVILGLVSIAVTSALSFMSGWTMQFWPEESVKDFVEGLMPPPEKIAEDLAVFRGTWPGQVVYRAPDALAMQTFVFFFWALWRAGGLMLVGMGMYKLGVFGAARSNSFYTILVTAAVLLGIPTIVFGILYNTSVEWDVRQSFFFGSQYNYWASIVVSLGWVSLVMLVCKNGVFAGLTTRLAAVGRMAFTNYILQTVICTTIFYGHGFGLYGRVERVGQILIVLAVWIVLLVVSPIWLRYFRFGPLEWVWRSLTYRKNQSMRR